MIRHMASIGRVAVLALLDRLCITRSLPRLAKERGGFFSGKVARTSVPPCSIPLNSSRRRRRRSESRSPHNGFNLLQKDLAPWIVSQLLGPFRRLQLPCEKYRPLAATFCWLKWSGRRYRVFQEYGSIRRLMKFGELCESLTVMEFYLIEI